MENVPIEAMVLGALIASAIGGALAAVFNIFPRLRKVENENAQFEAHKEAIDKRLDTLEQTFKTQAECMVSMKTDIAAIKVMLETAFNGKEKK